MTSPMLNPESVRTVARQRYTEASMRDDATCYANPLDVGRLATSLARQYFAAEAGVTPSNQVTVAQCAGMLVYALERWGYNFDGLVDVSEFRVARVVSGLSCDGRMPQGQRLEHHCSTLGASDAVAQIVKLAEIVAVTVQVGDGLTDAELALHGDFLVHRAAENLRLLGAMTHLRDHPRMRTVLAELRARLEAVPDVVDRARAALQASRGQHVTATPV